jgi:hypothetical protein
MKIKTFRFIGSSNVYNRNDKTNSKKYTKESDIDLVINDFLRDGGHTLVDIKIITVESNHHNNCGYNLVDLIYTVIYE